MNEFEETLKAFIQDNGIICEHLQFDQAYHSGEEAAISNSIVLYL